jgi:2-polyprenyl-3-methyl-5-hydroxy-6-metoxy-1,4-benzoquinol methylase
MSDGRDASPHELARGYVDAGEDREKKRGYLRFLPASGTVLDLGCGTGAFLDLLRDAGLPARGIDASPAAVAACRARGHAVDCADLEAAVARLQADPVRFSAVVLVHVIEHFDGPRALALLAAAAKLLAPSGVLLIVTPDPRSAIVLEETFWLDPTHVRPYPRALLERALRAAGLTVVASLRDPASRPRRSALRALLARLRSALSGVDRSGPMDALVVARREPQ